MRTARPLASCSTPTSFPRSKSARQIAARSAPRIGAIKRPPALAVFFFSLPSRVVTVVRRGAAVQVKVDDEREMVRCDPREPTAHDACLADRDLTADERLVQRAHGEIGRKCPEAGNGGRDLVK